MLFMRYVVAPWNSTMDVSDFKSTEWLRGEKLCTFNGAPPARRGPPGRRPATALTPATGVSRAMCRGSLVWTGRVRPCSS